MANKLKVVPIPVMTSEADSGVSHQLHDPLRYRGRQSVLSAARTPARVVALLTAVVVAVVIMVGAGSPAWGHARMVASDPADGQQLVVPPASVTFTFNEEVTATLGGIQVFDRDARRVDQGAGTQPVPSQLATIVDPDLPDGTYLATYRVVSADGHVVSGAVTFAVGEDLDRAAVAGLNDSGSTLDRLVEIVGNVLLYGGTLVGGGLGLVALMVVDTERQRRALLRWVPAACVIGLIGAAIKVAAIAAGATGRGVGSIVDDGVLTAVLRQGGVGWWVAGLLIGLAALAVGSRFASGALRQVLIPYGVLVAAGSFALTGHTAVGDPRWLVATGTVVHVVVAAVWVGGLVAVGIVLASSHTDIPSKTAVVSRFSGVALIAVGALWASGVVSAWWTVGSWTNLVDSPYGRILGVKLALVAVTMGIAAWNRWRLLPAVTGDTADERKRTLLTRSVRSEIVVLAAVVLATSVLVDTPPSRSQAADVQPFSETVTLDDDLEVNLLVTPGVTGDNEVHITYIDSMGLLDGRVESVTVEMSLPGADIGPLVTNAIELEAGHYLADTGQLVVAGNWELELVGRIGSFDQVRTTFSVPIG